MMPLDHSSILHFWFGDLDAEGCASSEQSKLWWRKDSEFDALIRADFEDDYRAIVGDQREEWLHKPESCLAYIIVLDQFSRNMFRGTGDMFAADHRAQTAALRGIDKGFDQELGMHPRVFFYMPLMHSENIERQDRCVKLFESLRDDCEERIRERFAGYVDYAVRHRDIIARFGRFPHRNAVLARQSTPEEQAFLKTPGSAF